MAELFDQLTELTYLSFSRRVEDTAYAAVSFVSRPLPWRSILPLLLRDAKPSAKACIRRGRTELNNSHTLCKQAATTNRSPNIKGAYYVKVARLYRIGFEKRAR